MFYATWSRGFRPGGINRQPTTAAYGPDFLTNYEAGWKTTFVGNRIRWNGAIYHQLWKVPVQLPRANSLTVIQNGRDASINGLESDINYVDGGLSLTAAAAYTDAKTNGNICHARRVDPTPNCTGSDCTPTTERRSVVELPLRWSRLPVTPKFKASGDRALSPGRCGPGHSARSGRVSYQGSAPIATSIASRTERCIGKIQASTAGRPVRRLRLGQVQRRIVRHERVRRSQRAVTRLSCCSSARRRRSSPGRPRTIGLNSERMVVEVLAARGVVRAVEARAWLHDLPRMRPL